jgi:Zn-dependent peptidase ImmA (M78 family)
LWRFEFAAGVAFFGRRGSSERLANAFTAELLMPKAIVIFIE